MTSKASQAASFAVLLANIVGVVVLVTEFTVSLHKVPLSDKHRPQVFHTIMSVNSHSIQMCCS